MPHELSDMVQKGRMVSPWKYTCACESVYQVTRDDVRLVAWGKVEEKILQLPSLGVLVLPPLPKLQ